MDYIVIDYKNIKYSDKFLKVKNNSKEIKINYSNIESVKYNEKECKVELIVLDNLNLYVSFCENWKALSFYDFVYSKT